MNKYFGGSTVQSNTVRDLGVSTFRDLVDRYFAIPYELAIGREAFHAKEKKERSHLKDGPYVTPCTFRKDQDGNCERNLLNAEHLVLLFLDIDEPKDARLVQDPKMVREALPFNHVVFRTANHTDAAPRVKIMVELVACEPTSENLLKGARHIAAKFGIPDNFKGLKESKVVVQPQYRPVRFRDDSEGNPALVSRRTNGKPLDLSEIADEGEEPEVCYAFTSGDVVSDLAFLPITGVSVEQMREPLMSLDPDIDYPDWRNVAFALRHQFRREDDAREAFELFDEWSSTGSKYDGHESTLAKWLSFSPEAEGRDPITIRSLFHMAQTAGWSHRKLAEETKTSVIDWMEKCDDEEELIDEAIRRIAALPFANKLSDAKMLDILRKRIKEVGGTLIDKRVLISQLSDARYIKKKEQAGDETPHWLNPFCYYPSKNLFINAATGVDMGPEGFNNAYSEHLMPTDGDSELAKTGRPLVLPVHYATNMIRVPKVDGLVYDPRDCGANTYVKEDGKIYLNTYRRNTLPEENDIYTEEAGELFMSHLRVLVREPEYVEILADFICHVVQFQGTKIRWMPVIQSAEGAGKGVLKCCVNAVVGEPNVTEVSADILSSQWNDWMVGTVLSYLEEVHTPGKSREVVSNAIKQFISDNRIPVNKRNTSASVQPNYTNALAFTNYRDAFALKESNRRMFCIESPLQSKAQIDAVVATGHYDRMEKLYKDPVWTGSLRTWMLRRRIADNFPVNGPAPTTVYREHVIAESRNKVEAELDRIISADKDPLVSFDLVLDARACELTDHLTRNNHSAFHTLRVMDYIPVRKDGVVWCWHHRTRWNEMDGDPVEEMERRVTEAGGSIF